MIYFRMTRLSRAFHRTLMLSEYVFINVIFVKSNSKCVAVRDTAPRVPFPLLHFAAYYVEVSQRRYKNGTIIYVLLILLHALQDSIISKKEK
jgi:hypothetical protein